MRGLQVVVARLLGEGAAFVVEALGGCDQALEEAGIEEAPDVQVARVVVVGDLFLGQVKPD